MHGSPQVRRLIRAASLQFARSNQIVIVINLVCEQSHPFEGWFRSSDDFKAQNAQGLVSCPICDSHSIVRKPSAPYLNSGARAPSSETGSTDGNPAQAPAPSRRQILQALRDLAANAEDVGNQFATEVRRVHNGEAEERSLRGKASRDELEELLEEGIGVLPVPPAEDSLH